MDLILSLESRRFGRSLAHSGPSLPHHDAGPIDLAINLTSGMYQTDAPLLTMDFCGSRDIAAVTGVLLAGQSPELIARIDGATVARARPMIADRLWLSRALDGLLSGAIALVVQTVARFFAGRLQPLAEAPIAPANSGGFLANYLGFVCRGTAARARRKLQLGRRPFYWQVAYRLIDGPGIAETGRLDGPAFTVLGDDGHRFYADPFAFEQDGRHFVFVEEFHYAVGRGVISVAELDEDGRLDVPRPVLEEPHHLSYPQVFAHDGDIFMIPESSAARELVLYRSDEFPDRWHRDTVLLDDVDINDATLFEHGGQLWLIGTQKIGRGSASDTMVAYFAPSLRGPWTPHALNPIAIDHSAARPGGLPVRVGDRLMLPVQDGSQSYGGGLGMMALERMDAVDVVFGAPKSIEPGLAWARHGIHTLNRCGRLEVIDSAG